MNQCPFSRKSMVQSCIFNETGMSFAQYVTHVNEPTTTMKTSRQINHRQSTLPKMESSPALESMKQHFFITTPKFTPKPKVRQSLELHRSVPAKLAPLVRKAQSRQQIDEDMSLFYHKVGGSVVVNAIVESFYEHTKGHPIIQGMDDHNLYKANFRQFLEYLFGRPVFYNLEVLRQKHANLQIKSREFDDFKSALIHAFLSANKGPPDLVYEFASLLEQFRYLIMSREKTFAQIYNQKLENKNTGAQETIINLAQQTYKKIFADTTLSVYFLSTVLEQQAVKLGKILNQMMGWSMEEDDSIRYLRQSHIYMHLTNVHFTLFKVYLIESMRELGIKDKQIEMVTKRMDGYRSCILNQDTLLDYINSSKSLYSTYLKKYENLLLKDPRLKDFPTSKIERHTHFIMQYLTKQHTPTLTRRDIQLVHSKCQIKSQWYQAFKDNFFTLISKFQLDQLIIQDYNDIWFSVRFSVFGYESIDKMVTEDQINNIQHRMQCTLQDNDNYNTYFRNADYQIKHHLKRIMSFIFKNLYIYKTNDLRVIHQNLGITESTFDLFVFLLKHTMLEEGVSEQLAREAEIICLYYKPCICTNKKLDVI